MGASVCFYFDEGANKDIEASMAQQWDRLGENWNVDAVIMVDETRAAGREWMEKYVPDLAYRQPWFRYTKIEDVIEEFSAPLVYIERKEMRPSHLSKLTVGLYKYQHRDSAIYVIGGHYGNGLHNMPVEGDWVHVPTGGPCGYAIQIAAMVMYDRARKEAVTNEFRTIKSKRERDMRTGLERAAQVTRSALKILDGALE